MKFNPRLPIMCNNCGQWSIAAARPWWIREKPTGRQMCPECRSFNIVQDDPGECAVCGGGLHWSEDKLGRINLEHEGGKVCGE